MSDPEAMQQFAHLNEVVALQMKIDDLEAENARLRAELDLERRRLATSEDLRTGLARALEECAKNER